MICLVAHWHGLLSDVTASLTELCATETSTVATLGQLLVLALVTFMWYISHMVYLVSTAEGARRVNTEKEKLYITKE